MKQTVIQMGNDLSVKIGDIFVNSWGYDQTNIDYSKVISFTPSGKSVTIVSIGQKIVEKTGDMTELVVPDPDNITSEPRMKRLGVWNNHIEAGQGNWKWDGKPERQSHYA